MAEVKRKKGESFEGLIRKFNKRMIQSGKIIQAKKIRYRQRKVNKNLSKKLALRRLDIAVAKERLRKLGLDKEE
jgi:DNA-binding GntR family transcriptional regulator